MSNPEQYLIDNNLWDLERLKVHAQEHSVYVIESPKFPGVVMLHYADACQYDNLWTSFSLMARGLLLDMKNKKVLAIPFFKWFNLGQVPETSYDVLKTLGSFQTSEKLDGSMMILFKDPNTDKLTFTTKGSLDSEHAQYANSLVMPKEFWEGAEKYNFTGTLIFELISKKFQIVIDYSKKEGYKEGLYLIGYRYNSSNRLAPCNEVANIAKELGVPTFKTYSFYSLDTLIDNARGLPVLEEGYVLRFENDLMVKVKGNAYLQMHRFISHLSDRNLLEAVANNTANELVTLCPEEYQTEVKLKIEYFEKRIANMQEEVYNKYIQAPKESRKEFAMWTNQNVEKYLRGFLFQLFDKKDLDRKHICKVIEEVEHVMGVTKI